MLVLTVLRVTVGPAPTFMADAYTYPDPALPGVLLAYSSTDLAPELTVVTSAVGVVQPVTILADVPTVNVFPETAYGVITIEPFATPSPVVPAASNTVLFDAVV